MKKPFDIKALKGQLIVSCQALEDEPLHGPQIMARMALAAQMGGAAGIRANTVPDILAIRQQVELPIIGIIKRDYADSPVYITPTMAEIRQLLVSPAEIIAMDATDRRRPDGALISEMVAAVHRAGKLAMADIATAAEGIRAAEAGFDLVSTTLSGYTPYTQDRDKPDWDLIETLGKKLKIPVAAEGHIKTPSHLARALAKGAYCAVVGGAITRPQLITRSFVDAISSR